MAEKLLTVDEVAQYVRLSGKTVWREIRRGHLDARKVCNRWLIRQADVEAWLERGRDARASNPASCVSVAPIAPDRGSLAALRQIEDEAA